MARSCTAVTTSRESTQSRTSIFTIGGKSRGEKVRSDAPDCGRVCVAYARIPCVTTCARKSTRWSWQMLRKPLDPRYERPSVALSEQLVLTAKGAGERIEQPLWNGGIRHSCDCQCGMGRSREKSVCIFSIGQFLSCMEGGAIWCEGRCHV